jgi:peptidoglycan/LPS O-acetylase OafA/YrhL
VTSRPHIPHVPALDGLRGASVAAILLFHAGHLPGGWLAVDLFFLLSGFLITSLLLVEFERRGTISLVAFWGRRARRLLPALFGALLGVAAYAALFAAHEELPRIRRDGLATLLYVANWNSIGAHREYWNLFVAPSPLEHTWTLAIEEQFYLLWPPLVLLLLGRLHLSARGVFFMAGALASASALWMAWVVGAEGINRAYLGTDTRAAAVLAGAALAALGRWRGLSRTAGHRRWLEALGIAATAGLAWAWLVADGRSVAMYRGGLSACLIGAAVVMAACLWGRGILARIFSVAPLRTLGLVSYGLYLWHWPVYVTLEPRLVGLDGVLLTGVRIAISLAFAVVSYFLIEQPVRRGAFSRRRAVLSAAMSGVAVAGVLVAVTRPAPSSVAVATDAEIEAVRLQTLEAAPERMRRLLVIGDSVAGSLGEELDALGPAWGVEASVRAFPGCSLLRTEGQRNPSGKLAAQRFLKECARFRDRTPERVRAFAPDAVVIVEGGPALGEYNVAGVWTAPCEKRYDEAYAADLESTVRQCQSAGARVLVAPMPPVDAAAVLAMFDGERAPPTAPAAPDPDEKAREATLVRLGEERIACQNDVRRRVVERTGAGMVDIAGFVCPQGHCLPERGEWRPDGIHFRGAAARAVAEWLLARVSADAGWTGDGG